MVVVRLVSQCVSPPGHRIRLIAHAQTTRPAPETVRGVFALIGLWITAVTVPEAATAQGNERPCQARIITGSMAYHASLAMARDLRGKVIVITGASSGIGRATALACAKAGMHVTLAARRAERIKEVAGECARVGGERVRAQWAICDVTDERAVRQVFAESWAVFGRLDAVFANAGYGLDREILETKPAEHLQLLDVNYLGTVRTLRAANEHLRRTPDGLKHMVICSSCLSELGLPGSGAYSASKAAQASLADALRAEVARAGISVTSVHPITTRTDFFKRSAELGGKAVPLNQHIPSQFVHTPEKVAGKILRCLRRPKPEIWPSPATRLSLALLSASPRLSAWALARFHRRQTKAAKGSAKVHTR